MNTARPFLMAALVALLAGCDGRPRLEGRALLPADTFAPGPSVGRALDGPVHGRTPPFAEPPVQGFSSLIPVSADTLRGGIVLVLGDNGFGARANSPAFPLRWYRLRLDFATALGGTGEAVVEAVVDLADPRGLAPFARRGETGRRVLTGADFDPESFVRLADGTFWVGEEFGPFLLHVDADGALLAPPVPTRLPEPLRGYGRGRGVLRSPDHPDLHGLDERLAVEMSNHPRSGGFEGLAASPAGDRLYAVLEKPPHDDPERDRRLVLEFDPRVRDWTGRWWSWRADGPRVAVGAADVTPDGALLIVERDTAEGPEARIKRVYRAPLGPDGAGEDLAKTLVADLLDLADPAGLTAPEADAHGLGPDFAFPYVTPECLAVIDFRTLLAANDNNYPFSSGRRAGAPDDNEFILLALPRPLDEGAP